MRAARCGLLGWDPSENVAEDPAQLTTDAAWCVQEKFDGRKLKFHESASFIVGKIYAKRSIGLLLFHGDKIVSAGNVNIPPNQ